MAMTEAAAQTARRAARSDVLEVLTRTGFLGYALFHLAVAWLAVQIALGRPAPDGDQFGAFQTVARYPFGEGLLLVVIVGLSAMAIWQLLLAAVGHRSERGRARTFERVASAGRVLIYSALAWTAVRVVSGARISSASQQQHATSGILTHAWGRGLVVVAGLSVLALGVGMVVYGYLKEFERRLRVSQMSDRVHTVAVLLGQIGYIAKGVAFSIVGVLLVQAAVTKDAWKSRGLDAALRTVAAQRFGSVLLLIVAGGVAAFGVYCFFQARFRKVHP
jgi:hypothetical protein